MTIGGVEFDWQLMVVITVATVLPMFSWYGHKITDTRAYDHFIQFFILPALIIWLLFRQPLSSYGFAWGNWRVGLVSTAVVCFAMAFILYLVVREPSMSRYYKAIAPNSHSQLLWHTAVELFAWEFLWRGFLLFALAKTLGPGPAILLQAVPFALFHLGKPEVETLTTLFGGIGFGFIAWQTQSFVYPFFIHAFMVVFTILVATSKI